jgi:MFS transporter, putative metabolite:H+ symporter
MTSVTTDLVELNAGASLPGTTVPVSKLSQILNMTVWVAALGYFVDMYDISLFGIVRVTSLKAIGITEPAALLTTGAYLINCQMFGMLLGGILWGILGDKRGRLSVLFGSIMIYSGANLLNAFITNVDQYALLRFIAGVGLAGELGAAITLVSEVMPKEVRGYGTTIVATLGLCGSATAALVGDFFTWKVAYLVGGAMGLCLLATRFNILESGMFTAVHRPGVRRGAIGMLFKRQRLGRYVKCILIGVPIWFVTGVLMTFAPEFARNMDVTAPVTVGKAVLVVAIGLTLGDLASGLLSQWLKSRKLAVGAFLSGMAALATVYLTVHGLSPTSFYALCFCLGICAGYWAVFVTIAAEQFGTNLRSTVATTVPNFVRGSLVLVNLGFTALHTRQELSVVHSAMIIGMFCFAGAFISLFGLEETYGKDLNFNES